MAQYDELKAMIGELDKAVNAIKKTQETINQNVYLLGAKQAELTKTHGALYHAMSDVPDWAKPAVEDAVKRGMIKGVAADTDGNIADLGLSHSDLRILTMVFRRDAGLGY